MSVQITLSFPDASAAAEALARLGLPHYAPPPAKAVITEPPPPTKAAKPPKVEEPKAPAVEEVKYEDLRLAVTELSGLSVEATATVLKELGLNTFKEIHAMSEDEKPAFIAKCFKRVKKAIEEAKVAA